MATLKTLARENDKAEILRRLKALDAGSKRRWGRMSAHQMVCHLADSFRMAAGERRAASVAGLFQRTFLKWTALYLPLRWPPGIRTLPEVDQELGGTRPGQFAADVANLEALTDVFTRPNQRFAPAHPIFGRMSDRAWLRWAYLHMDHHLRQFGV